MANSASYMQGRKSFLRGAGRPQALLLSDNPGTFQDGYFYPTGDEGQDFIILSDHNRSEINISQRRIENRQRMVNGGMRSYWIADKIEISVSWDRLPSRPFDSAVTFDEDGKIEQTGYISYTADGAAGGMDMLSWYESHPGPFYVFLSYDKYRTNNIENYDRLYTYNQILKAYFSSFSHSVEKRSGANFDFWNVSFTLEEV